MVKMKPDGCPLIIKLLLLLWLLYKNYINYKALRFYKYFVRMYSIIDATLGNREFP